MLSHYIILRYYVLWCSGDEACAHQPEPPIDFNLKITWYFRKKPIRLFDTFAKWKRFSVLCLPVTYKIKRSTRKKHTYTTQHRWEIWWVFGGIQICIVETIVKIISIYTLCGWDGCWSESIVSENYVQSLMVHSLAIVCNIITCVCKPTPTTICDINFNGKVNDPIIQTNPSQQTQ